MTYISLLANPGSVIDLTDYKNTKTYIPSGRNKNSIIQKSYCKGELAKNWVHNKYSLKKRNSKSVPIKLKDTSGRLINPISVPDAFNNYFTNIPNANSCYNLPVVHPSKNPRSMFSSSTDSKEVL